VGIDVQVVKEYQVFLCGYLSTVKLDARMRVALEKSVANNELGVGRSAYD
jgi:hypothetical protein